MFTPTYQEISILIITVTKDVGNEIVPATSHQTGVQDIISANTDLKINSSGAIREQASKQTALKIGSSEV